MTNKLKPCPFCGEKTFIYHGKSGSAKTHQVSCRCGATGPDGSKHYATAVKKWNTRGDSNGR